MEEFCTPLLYKAWNLDQKESNEEMIRLNTTINDYIWSTIEPYVSFIEAQTPEKLIEDSCVRIVKDVDGNEQKSTDYYNFHTESSYTSEKRHLEIIFATPNLEEKKATLKLNAYGCLCSLSHTIVENNCILLANEYDISSPSTKYLKLTSITKDDLVRVIRRRYFYSAVLIKDNQMCKYYYQNPQYLVKTIFEHDEEKDLQVTPTNILKYQLRMIHRDFKKNSNQYLNQIATRIAGKTRLYGDILILNMIDENVYYNISIHELRRLNVLSYGRIYDRQLKSEEDSELGNLLTGQSNQRQIYMSRYVLLHRRMKIYHEKLKNRCHYCEKLVETPITCTGCYRFKYCSNSCLKDDQGAHKDDCI
jgi:hypothetical protein